jgi:hypothetical protein
MADVEKQALAGASGASLAMYQQMKLGDNCCGCCCDMRRATIFVSILFISVSALSAVLLLAGEFLRLSTKDAFDDDELLDVLEDSYFAQCIVTSIGLVTSTCSLLGAIRYNVWLVGVNIVWMVVTFFATMTIEILAFKEINGAYAGTEDIKFSWWNNLVSALILLFWIYPLARFIREVNMGIMSPETYPREDFSCCCTPTRKR